MSDKVETPAMLDNTLGGTVSPYAHFLIKFLGSIK
jgi:hypothetical protein